MFDDRAILQIPKYTELPSLSIASTSQVLIPDIPPPSKPLDFPHTPTSFDSNFDSQSVLPFSSSTKHLERHLVVNIPLHPMSVPTDESPTCHHISGFISTIHSSEASSPSASSVPEISTSQHASLGARPINPPDRYGDWHYSFTAVGGTLPPVPKTYEETINSLFMLKEWKAAMDAAI